MLWQEVEAAREGLRKAGTVRAGPRQPGHRLNCKIPTIVGEVREETRRKARLCAADERGTHRQRVARRNSRRSSGSRTAAGFHNTRRRSNITKFLRWRLCRGGANGPTNRWAQLRHSCHSEWKRGITITLRAPRKPDEVMSRSHGPRDMRQ